VIVSRVAAGLMVVLQIDHQEQCRAAADAWGNETFRRVEPWAPVVVAAAVHDEGWRAWESAPEVDPEGAPVDFLALDRARHVALSRHGIDLAFARSPRVGLLVSMHCGGLYRARLGLDGDPPDPATLAEPARGFVAGEMVRQDAARRAIGAADTDRWAWDAYRLLQAWDALSLYLTWRGLPGGRSGRLPRVPEGPGRPGVDLALTPVDALTAACEPFPFAGDEAVLPVRARVIPDRPYVDDADLGAALADAPVEERRYRVIRPPGSRPPA
jgi:hypothetical protein